MKHVLSRQAAAIVSYLERNAYSKDNPFVPFAEMTITLSIELPCKYVYKYPYRVFSAWAKDGGLFVSCRPAWPGASRKKEVCRILDDELETEDYEDESFGTYQGVEISYWDLSNMLEKFFLIEPFSCNDTPFEGDFFSIEEDENGRKQIHIDGSNWKSDDEWRHSEYVFLIVPLDEFVSNFAARGIEYVDELFEGAKTGILEHTSSEIVQMMNHYFNGERPDGFLDYCNISLDTPVGNYAVKWK